MYKPIKSYKMKNYKLYIYELHSSDNVGGGFRYGKSKVGIISESDEMTLEVLQEEYDFGDFWGDVEEFEQRDEDGGHKYLELLKVADVDPLWVSKLGVGNLHEFDDALLMPILFDAKEFVKQLSELENSHLDELIKEIEGLKK